MDGGAHRSTEGWWRRAVARMLGVMQALPPRRPPGAPNPAPSRPASPTNLSGTNASGPWRPRHLLRAPHRIGFFLAMLVLLAGSLWWTEQQFGRLGWIGLPVPAVSPTFTHATVMVFGFMPLFFSGFLFTAGPKWLHVAPPDMRRVAAAAWAMGAGWLGWLAGACVGPWLALSGLLAALLGFASMTAIFLGLVRASRAPDKVHARLVGLALYLGTASLALLPVALLRHDARLQHALTNGALWSCVTLVFVTIAHRMIPFFTSSALPFVRAWRPCWVLWLMAGTCLAEAGLAWVEGYAPWSLSPAWVAALRGLAELAIGASLTALAVRWGLVQSLRDRLLAMLHLGFAWFGLALLLGGCSQLLGWFGDAPALPLAALHALTMGCLGSLCLAMVTRVSCGHGGRPLVADGVVWCLFVLLQGATLLRLAATVPDVPAQPLLALAALLWTGVMLGWAARHLNWYGRPRPDGRPG